MKTTVAFTSFLAVSFYITLLTWGAVESQCQAESLRALDRVSAYATGRTQSMNFMDCTRIGSLAPVIYRKAMARANRELASGKASIGLSFNR